MFKNLFIISVVLALLLVGCSQGEISLDAYADFYYQQMSQMEMAFQSGMLQEAVDMISPAQFNELYSNEAFVHDYDQFITSIDKTLYELSVVGPQLSDEILMKYQAKLEENYQDLMSMMKLYRERDTFSTLAVNNFSLYDDIYSLMRDINPILADIHKNQFEIEKYLYSESLENDDYMIEKYKNAQAYYYTFAILSSRVAAYQDYSGLQVNPRWPDRIQATDGSIYLTAELDYNVMLDTVERLSTALEYFSETEEVFQLKAENDVDVAAYLEQLISEYEAYAKIRSQFSYDFFKTGEFKDFQARSYDKDIVGDVGLPVYTFSEEYEEKYQLLQMREYFIDLIAQININNHAQYMNVQE